MSRITGFIPLALLPLMAACADGPLQTSPADADPAVAAANRLIGAAGRVVSIRAESSGARGAARAEAPPADGVAALRPPPPFCDPSNLDPECPEFYMGTSIYINTAASPKTAHLFGYLDAISNVSSSSLSVTFKSVGGCSGTPGTFDSDYLTGGSTGSGWYSISGTRVPSYSGTVKWAVEASGTAHSPFGAQRSDWSSTAQCG